MRSLYTEDIVGTKPRLTIFDKGYYKAQHDQQIRRNSKKYQRNQQYEWFTPLPKPNKSTYQRDPYKNTIKLISEHTGVSQSMHFQNLLKRNDNNIDQQSRRNYSLLSNSGVTSLNRIVPITHIRQEMLMISLIRQGLLVIEVGIILLITKLLSLILRANIYRSGLISEGILIVSILFYKDFDRNFFKKSISLTSQDVFRHLFKQNFDNNVQKAIPFVRMLIFPIFPLIVWRCDYKWLYLQYFLIKNQYISEMALRMSKRLQKQYESIQKNNQDLKVLLPNNDLALWHVNFAGAKGTLYQNENFTLQLRFTNEYPIQSPEVIFIGHIPIHQHIYSNGFICLSILYDQWSPALTVSSICLSVLSMLSSAPKKIKPPNDAEFVKRAAGRGPKAFLWSYHDDKA